MGWNLVFLKKSLRTSGGCLLSIKNTGYGTIEQGQLGACTFTRKAIEVALPDELVQC